MKKHKRKHLRVNFIDMFWISANVVGATVSATAAAATISRSTTHTHSVQRA